MAFIETTAPNQTKGVARAMLERQQKHYGYVPNYAKVFSDRPDIMNLWADLLAGIRRHIEPRRFELVTFAAALELGSSYCALAHGEVLQKRFLSPEEMRAIAAGDPSALPEAERAAMDLARKVISDSSSVTHGDVDRLRRAGLTEGEIFDVVATAAARAFFAKLADALGAQPDCSFMEMDAGLRERLSVGRPISAEAVERIDEGQPGS
ncbi:MAG TPA: carboxymuconolactone decarboxylase family protein [Myxococcota bacterium]